MEWQEGELKKAVIHSLAGKPCVVRYGGKTKELNLKKGESTVVNPKKSS